MEKFERTLSGVPTVAAMASGRSARQLQKKRAANLLKWKARQPNSRLPDTLGTNPAKRSEPAPTPIANAGTPAKRRVRFVPKNDT